MKPKSIFKPIILVGGSGERFWPLSTPENPKQFLSIFGDFSWDDVGGYLALEKHFPLDASGNVLLGSACQLHSRNVSIVSRGLPITVLGATNLVVVSTPTQLFVVDKSSLGQMKELMDNQ